ncbi:MAG TPA: putative sulfate exporter family transporter [Dysgonamonadaceae bacterium]|nr:putative sulfate exporter family transporter [Dysgonamonadaceae bacterium]
MKSKINKPLFFIGIVACLLPFVSPAIALFMGLLLGFTVGNPYTKQSSKASKYLLQFAVVGLGFGMNLHESLQSGKEGMLFTIVSVIGVLAIGYWLGRRMLLDTKTSYLISSGTAICGGSAIAAVAPIIKASPNQMSISLGTVFILNAIALFIFPPIGRFLELTQEQFGMWAAIAIHDTSSVVGAGAAYGHKALEVATMVKLTRALWIIPISIATTFFFKQKESKIKIPWFIFFFILAMIVNTVFNLPEGFTSFITMLSKRGMTVTLFLIGSGLSLKTLKTVGVKPLLLGVTLWIFIGVISLVTILFI